MHLTAKILAEARAALVSDLRAPQTAQWVHRPIVRGVRNTQSTGSFNWAGYADIATSQGAFKAVRGSWKVPKVTCTPEDRITSEWVGLDGATTGTVEQDGTSSQCFKGTALYYDWFEMFPAGTIKIANVSAGDSISASVSRTGTKYTLKLTDSGHSAASFSKSKSCAASTCLDESAEWITERPAFSSTGIVPEAQFATAVKFTKGAQTSSKGTGSIGGYSGTIDDITCVDSTSSYDIVATSGLTGGNSFSDTWKNSY